MISCIRKSWGVLTLAAIISASAVVPAAEESELPFGDASLATTTAIAQQPDVVVPVPPLPGDLTDLEKLRAYAKDAKAAGALDQAEEALRRLLSQQPTDYAATIELGSVLLQARQNAEAQQFLEGAVHTFTPDARLSTLLSC
jgi:Flp pilus assembly protein TadD